MSDPDATDPEFRLRALATGQFGLLHHRDLWREGLDAHAIRRRVEACRLTRVHDMAFAWGHTALRDEGRWLAAVWACGKGAVLSHTSAAAFHRMYVEEKDAPVHVSTPRQARTREGITVHRARYLDPKDFFSPHPLQVTSIPRTLIDLADELPWDEYRAVADRLPQLRLDKVKEAQERAPRRRGATLVHRLIEADDAHTKSEFERRFARFSKEHSLPRPDDLNVKIAGHEADCHYASERLVVELDGRAYHERRDQMRKDRQRDFDYQVAGYRILRLLWDELHPNDARRTANKVRQMLAGRVS